MSNRADISIIDDLGSLFAVFEVKRKLATTQEWAAKLRRNLVVHGVLPGQVEWFVVATPDRLYVWRAPVEEDFAPTYVVDAAPLFGPIFEAIGTTADEIAPSAFEMLVAVWLTNTLAADVPKSLRQLAEAAQTGRVEIQAA